MKKYTVIKTLYIIDPFYATEDKVLNPSSMKYCELYDMTNILLNIFNQNL